MILLLCAYIQPSCAHNTSTFQLEKTYRKDLIFYDEKGQHEGIYVADKMPSYHFRIRFSEKPRLMKIRSCHRELVFDNPGKHLDFTYEPETGLEDTIDPCFLELASFTKEGYNQTALIDFHRDEALVGTLTCNGKRIETTGVSICQTRAGLLQRMEFEHPVIAEGLSSCPKIQDRAMTFIFPVSIGICLYFFYDGKNFHKLVTFGYDDVPGVSSD